MGTDNNRATQKMNMTGLFMREKILGNKNKIGPMTMRSVSTTLTYLQQT